MDQKKYDAVIDKLLLSLQKYDVTSKEYQDILTQINNCVNVSQTFDRIENERIKISSEKAIGKKRLKNDAIIGLIGLGVGVFTQIWGMTNILNFETTNSFTSKLASPLVNLFIKRG